MVAAPPGYVRLQEHQGGNLLVSAADGGNRKRQQYRPRAPLAWIAGAREARARLVADADQRARLCSMLIAGGAATESAPTLRILSLLAQAGVFRVGGILVGTQAFGAYGNMLGVRFEQQAMRTQDIDIAQDRSIGIALAETAPLKIEQLLTRRISDSPRFSRSMPGSRALRSSSGAGICEWTF